MGKQKDLKKLANKYISKTPLPQVEAIQPDAVAVKPIVKQKKQVGTYEKVDSTLADIIRDNVLPAWMPDNVKQMSAKLIGDSRMSNNSLSDQQKVMMWDVIQQAKKRTGKSDSGTEYEDYATLGMGSADDYNNWFNRGNVELIEGIKNSYLNPGFTLASTVGRGRYWTDPENPNKMYYTDVYDWNPGEKYFAGNKLYQVIRNNLRAGEDQNLNKEKNNNFRMNFEFDADEIEKLREKLNRPSEYNLDRNGGWLEKYNDGGPVQENYNDYSVTVPPNYKGEGYFNEGRDYSPAWGGQFEDGGEIPQFKPGGKAKKKPVIVADENDPRLKAYQDSLRLYNYSNRLMRKATPHAQDYTFPENPKLYEDYVIPYNPTGTTTFFNGEVEKIGLGPSSPYYNGIDFRKEVEKSLKTKNKPLGWTYADVSVPVYKKPTQPVVARVYQKETPELQDLQAGLPVDISLPELQRQAGPNRITMGKPLFPGGPQTDYYTPIDETGNVVQSNDFRTSQFKEGGPVKRFLQPTQTFMNIGYNPKENGLSTEYSTTVGKDGEYYLVPGYKQGRLVEYPEDLFNQTGEHLGGPFKTIQSAEDFAKFRHNYVEKNKNIPAPFKTRDYAMGGSVNMPTIKDKGSFNKDGVWIPDWKAMAAQAKKLGAKKVKTDRGGVINFNDKWEAVSADDSNNMAMGGSIAGATQGIPGATGFMYARTGSTPSEDKYAKKNIKTVASAQVGIELIKGEETQPVKTPAIKSEERIKAQEKVIDTAPVDIIEEGRSKFRFNMLQDAVKHDMAMEQGIALDDVNNKELKNRTKELLAKREAKLANPTVEFVKGNGTVNNLAGGEYILGYYNPENKNALVSLSDNLDQLDVDKFQSTTRHEFRHAYDDGGKYLTNYEKELIGRKTNTDNVEKQKAIGIDRYEYLKDPTEVTARLQDIRGALKDNPRTTGYLKKKKDDLFTLDNKVDKEGYYLDDITKERMPIQKTYDAKKDKATYEDLYYLNEKTKNSGLQDLLKVMKADDIVELLNTIAANNPQQGMPMAQNGAEMKFYQNGLDFKPKSISKNGKKVIKDPKGQWAHPGEVTQIPSNQITMQGVPYPVLGISDTGDMQMMYPDEEYQYDGESVTEYPMMKQGGQLTKLDQLTNFTNYNTKQPGGWLDKYQ